MEAAVRYEAPNAIAISRGWGTRGRGGRVDVRTSKEIARESSRSSESPAGHRPSHRTYRATVRALLREGYTPIDPAAGRGKRVQPRVRRPTRLRSIIEECRTARTAMHASPNARRARLLAAKRRVWVKRGLVDRRTRCKPAAHLLPVGDTSREHVMLRGLDASRRSRLPRDHACNFRR